MGWLGELGALLELLLGLTLLSVCGRIGDCRFMYMVFMWAKVTEGGAPSNVGFG